MTDATKNLTVLEALVLQLREANQNLVIASVRAQDLQGQAEATNQRQKEFLSMLAHELRNPLAPIAMATELLAIFSTAHPQLPKIHGIIDRQLKHMTHLVDDLMDVSRVSGGKITLKKTRVLLAEVIESALEISQPFIDHRNQHVSIDVPAGPVEMDGDLVRLAQAMSNLLINASKFTPEYGHIAVSARKLVDDVVISIKDDGMGIAPELQPFIFDLFTQGPRSLDRSQGGLGIGLSLVRTITEMHGGNVKVHSDGPGLGSEFIVQLPVSAAPLSRDRSPPSNAAPARACRILLIEDNADANEALHHLLVLGGHTITCASDGVAGLALARQNRYDVIISDIGLPGMDGYEVVRQLRQHAVHPLPCCIAMTGYNEPESRTRAIEAGFAHYLIKPIAMVTLMNLIASSTIC